MNKELILTQAHIENRIFTIRGVQVMLDRDLAEMYQVETKVLNQATKRNPERFPVDFMFQLTHAEWEDLMSQNATLKNENLKSQNVTSSLRSQNVTLKNNRGKHCKYLPFVSLNRAWPAFRVCLEAKAQQKCMWLLCGLLWQCVS